MFPIHGTFTSVTTIFSIRGAQKPYRISFLRMTGLTLPRLHILRRLVDKEGGKDIGERQAAQGLHEEKLSLRVDLEEHGLIVVGQLHIEDPHDQTKLVEGVTQPLFEVAVERVRTEGHVEIHPPVECLGLDERTIAALANDGDAQVARAWDAFLVDRRRQGQDLLVVEQLLADYRCRRQLDATRRRDGLDDRARMRRAKAANVHWILTDERGRDPETGALRGM